MGLKFEEGVLELIGTYRANLFVRMLLPYKNQFFRVVSDFEALTSENAMS